MSCVVTWSVSRHSGARYLPASLESALETGFAAGEDTGTPARDVLADLLAVLGSEPGQHWPVLAERLAAQFPDRWAGATAEAVSAQCRDLGVPSVDVKVSGTVLKGCRKTAVRKAAGT